jgi:hypothetical protein
MNKNREYNLWAYRKDFVSGILTAMLILTGLVVLFPLSSNVVLGYTMPADVDWDMDDLVTNSSGAVTSIVSNIYSVHEDIEISMNSTLTVNPGQIVYFDLGAGFSVYGYFSAAGNDTSVITFTSNEVDPSFGDWDGISFYNGSSGFIRWVDISYAENGILIKDVMLPAIRYSEFTYNVWVNGSWGSIARNDFITNIGGVKVQESTYLYIMHNYFFNNTVYGIYCKAEDYWNQTYMNIYDNDIISNPNYGIYASLGFDSMIDSNNITENRVGRLDD